MDKFVIIDGNSLINRAFYATPLLTNSKGQYTNAVYAFTNMLIRIMEDIAPEHMAVAFDTKAKTFRHGIYTGYKASRKGMPEELAAQMPLLKELLSAMDVKMLEHDGFEADDIIGTLAVGSSHKNIIITGDRDAFQLINPNTIVHFTKRGISEIIEMDEKTLYELYRLTPQQVVDYKALCGDASDEIPGVRGIGDKTATKLIEEYGSLDNIYANIDQITGSLQAKLISGKDSAYLSRKLAAIKTDCPGCFAPISEFTYTYPFSQKAARAFEFLEFKRLLARQQLFAGEVAMPAPRMEVEITDILSLNQLEEVVKSIIKSSSDISIIFGKMAINFSHSGSQAEYAIKISDTFLPGALSFDAVMMHLKTVLEDEGIRKVLFDAKSAMHILRSVDVAILGAYDDVCLMRHILNSAADAYNIQEMLSEEDYPTNAPAAATLKLCGEYHRRLKEQGQAHLYNNIELPLIDVLYDMELIGFKMDTQMLSELSKKVGGELEELSQQIFLTCGEQFNINSPKQLSVILFDKLGLKPLKKTKSGHSTDNEVLEKLADRHPVIPMVMRHRQLSKLMGTYIDGFKGVIDQNGFVHTVFKQALTTTGRLSSNEPNLQNIPIRDEEGREIRKMFIASAPDRILVTADYSQIELRLLAHFSQDQNLIEAFKSGQDIHTATAAQVFGVSVDEVDADMRRNAKAVNFGIIYGISDFGLSRQLNIMPARAKAYINRYFDTYSAVKTYMDENIEFAKQHGYALTITGRKRFIPQIASPNYNMRSFGERAAMNMPLQGSAADLIKIAMVEAYERLKALPEANLILQVHDELILDVKKQDAQKAAEILRECMENAAKLDVPLTVSISMGDSWYSAN